MVFVNKSCIIENYDKPDSSFAGFKSCNIATEQLFSLTATVDQLRILNLWYTADNQTEKNQIEDDYFPNNKVRLLENDTISISGAYKVYTGGKSLLNNTWVVKTSYYLIDKHNVIYNVHQVDNNNYTIERNDKGDNCKVFQTVEVVIPNEEYVVTNQSTNIPLRVLEFDYLSFNTVKPVTLVRQYESTAPWWDTCINTANGEIEITAILNSNSIRDEYTKAIFTKDYTNVTFRGIQKDYINPCLDNLRLY